MGDHWWHGARLFIHISQKGATGPGVGSSATITELYITLSRALQPLCRLLLGPTTFEFAWRVLRVALISLINLLRGSSPFVRSVRYPSKGQSERFSLTDFWWNTDLFISCLWILMDQSFYARWKYLYQGICTDEMAKIFYWTEIESKVPNEKNAGSLYSLNCVTISVVPCIKFFINFLYKNIEFNSRLNSFFLESIRMEFCLKNFSVRI